MAGHWWYLTRTSGTWFVYHSGLVLAGRDLFNKSLLGCSTTSGIPMWCPNGMNHYGFIVEHDTQQWPQNSNNNNSNLVLTLVHSFTFPTQVACYFEQLIVGSGGCSILVSGLWTLSKADCVFKIYSAVDCCFSVYLFLFPEKDVNVSCFFVLFSPPWVVDCWYLPYCSRRLQQLAAVVFW